MPGFTTTGATVLVDFGQLDRATIFWRALTQWLGGMGVITLFVAMLPRLAFGVRQLFFTEAPGPTAQSLAPHVRETAAYLWRLYAGLTAAELIVLQAAGMPLFDAACHALTTLSAGGFSPNPQSIMGYQSPAIEWILCLFMFLAGANFALQYRVLLGRPGALLRDEEFRACAGVVLLALMFIGGCAGSAAGGPKVLRHLLIGRYTLLELRRTLHPRGVLVFFLFYVLVFAVTAACVIGLGGVGPMASYGDLHPFSKVLLTATMWIGRLEIIAVLALLRWEVWRFAHWRSQAPQSAPCRLWSAMAHLSARSLSARISAGRRTARGTTACTTFRPVRGRRSGSRADDPTLFSGLPARRHLPLARRRRDSGPAWPAESASARRAPGTSHRRRRFGVCSPSRAPHPMCATQRSGRPRSAEHRGVHEPRATRPS